MSRMRFGIRTLLVFMLVCGISAAVVVCHRQVPATVAEKRSEIDAMFNDEFYSVKPQSENQLMDSTFSDLFQGLNIQPKSNYQGWSELTGGFFRGDYVCSRRITLLNLLKNESDDSLNLETVALLRIKCTIPWQLFPRSADITFEEIEPFPMNKQLIEYLANEVANTQ